MGSVSNGAAAAMGSGRVADGAAKKGHERGLLLVALFKLSKTVFFALLGIAALKLLHRNVGELVMRLSGIVPLDPQGHFVSLVMDRADLIGSHQLRLVSIGALTYSALCLVEGIGLLMEKVWAEYFTLVLTTLALPFEMYEIVREAAPWKIGFLIANALVVVYLFWYVRREAQRKRA